MGVITFNNIDSWGTGVNDLKIHVSKQPDWEFPERKVEKIEIPGRNGALLFDTGVYKNVERKYSIWAGPEAGDFPTLASKISKWLHSTTGYARLEDSYEPDYYRMATYIDEGSIENLFNEAGKIDISFDCKPQRYLKSGDIATVYNSRTNTITNPTRFVSKPIIKVTRPNRQTRNDAIFLLGGTTYTIGFSSDSSTNEVILDCDSMDCYAIINGTIVNKNSIFSSSNNSFPEFISGINYLTIQYISGTILSCSLEVTPKWYTI